MTEAEKKWYKPREIANLGLIKNSKGDSGTSHYYFIINLIRDGKLKAKDYSRLGSRPFWLVSKDEIDRYNNADS